MKMCSILEVAVLSCVFVLSLVHFADGIYCYRCTSSQPGCGKTLSIRLWKQRKCPDTGPYGGENFCVKVIEYVNSDVVITRECLQTLRNSEKHREKLPSVQRHNYCELGRNNDPRHHPYDENLSFCFCNDWNGCNAANSPIRSRVAILGATLLACCISYIISLLAH